MSKLRHRPKSRSLFNLNISFIRDKAAFAASLKLIWQAGDKKAAREQVKNLRDRYETKYPKALEVLDNGLKDSLSYYDFPSLDSIDLTYLQS
ncbi:MAG: transposase [Eubacteriales bacterium]|nr:transposase [Eubacteriales bacterium]